MRCRLWTGSARGPTLAARHTSWAQMMICWGLSGCIARGRSGIRWTTGRALLVIPCRWSVEMSSAWDTVSNAADRCNSTRSTACCPPIAFRMSCWTLANAVSVLCPFLYADWLGSDCLFPSSVNVQSWRRRSIWVFHSWFANAKRDNGKTRQVAEWVRAYDWRPGGLGFESCCGNFA